MDHHWAFRGKTIFFLLSSTDLFYLEYIIFLELGRLLFSRNTKCRRQACKAIGWLPSPQGHKSLEPNLAGVCEFLAGVCEFLTGVCEFLAGMCEFLSLGCTSFFHWGVRVSLTIGVCEFLSPFACVPGVPAAISGFSYGPAIGIRGPGCKKDVHFQLDSCKNSGQAH